LSLRAGQVWEQGEPYERYVGRWSRLVAREFLDWLGVEPGAAWLDVGSGTGALSETILRVSAPRSVTGVDSAERFVEHARAAVPGASFVVGDAQELPFEDACFDAVVSGLVLNFVPDPGHAVAELTRVARPGGAIAAYVWDYAGRMELMRYFWDAAGELDPAARDLDEGIRFRALDGGGLERLFSAADQAEVSSRAIDVPTIFRDFDDYWEPFLGGQGPAPAYVASLDGTHRAQLRELLRGRLPTGGDRSIRLVARAWAVRGVSRARRAAART
jgi:SAM-dependent methyltransferase